MYAIQTNNGGVYFMAYIACRFHHYFIDPKKKTGTCVFGTKQNVRIEGRKSRWPAREWM